MRNYFKSLNLSATQDLSAIDQALKRNSRTAEALSETHQIDAKQIFANQQRLEVYANTVALYEAMHEAKRHLQESPAIDTHQWSQRLENFDNLDEGEMVDLYKES